MTLVLHETDEAYETEYRLVRAALVREGSSLAKWCEENGVSRQLAERALRGKSFGPESVFEKGHGHRLTRVADAAIVMRVSATQVSCS